MTSAGAVAAVVRKIAIVRTSHLVQVAATVTVNQVNHLYIMHSNTNTVATTYGNTFVWLYKCVAGITISIVAISACIFRKMMKHYTGFCDEL